MSRGSNLVLRFGITDPIIVLSSCAVNSMHLSGSVGIDRRIPAVKLETGHFDNHKLDR